MSDHLTSKRNFFQTGVILVVAVGLSGTFGILSIFKVLKDLDAGIPFIKTMFFAPLILLPIAGYSIYYLLSRLPRLTVDKSGLTFSTIFKTTKYQWNEVENIELTDIQIHKFLFLAVPEEAITFKFKDNSTLVFWAGNYRNISDLRVVLDRADKLLKDKTKSISSLDFVVNRQPYSDTLVSFTTDDIYNGNNLLTFEGFFFFGVLIFVGFLISKKPVVYLTHYLAILVTSFVALVYYFIWSHQMHFFILTDKFLIIKNNVWFWRKHIYSLDNIREVVFTVRPAFPTSIKIITKDFKGTAYSSKIKDKTWDLLIEKLLSKEVNVKTNAFK